VNRRQFLSLAAGVAGAGAATRVINGSPSALAAPARKSRPPKTALMKVGTQQGSASDEQLRFYARCGVRNICGTAPRPGPKGYWTVEQLLKLRERVESFGISLDMLPIPYVSIECRFGQKHYIMLGQSPGRDRQIECICEMIRAAAKAGIWALKYNMTLLGVPRTEPTPGRGGCHYSTWILKKARRDLPLTEAGVVSADQMWERITYFLERVVPVAEEYKVRLACHPHDPPMPPQGYRGVCRVLGTVAGLKRFVAIAESPYHGLNFCQGTVAEMLQDPAREIFGVIRYFAQRNKIFNVHFRNIRGRRDDFREVYPDEGDVDMFQAMRVYKEAGYSYMVMPDHVPQHEEDPGRRQGFAFAFGYIRALIQAVDACP